MLVDEEEENENSSGGLVVCLYVFSSYNRNPWDPIRHIIHVRTYWCKFALQILIYLQIAMWHGAKETLQILALVCRS